MATTTISDISNAVVFYVEDIVFSDAGLDKNQIRELLIKNHLKTIKK